MKKILFNDKFMLTKAVLEGRKTQTRRLLTLTLHKKTDEGDNLIEVHPSKVFFEDGKWKFEYDGYVFLLPKENYPKYNVGEVVAVAQSYRDCGGWSENGIPNWQLISKAVGSKNSGWYNKMFVRGDLMPHQIRITDVRVEKLQDISDEDCLKEGIYEDGGDDAFIPHYFYNYENSGYGGFDLPQMAYADLINRISGKRTWESNPYVFVYDFELVK